MKAVLYDHHGPPSVLRVAEVDEPGPLPGHARVRVEACALNPKDVLLRKGKLWFVFPGPLPRVPGYDVGGTLLDDADGLTAGTRVFGMIQANGGGGLAEVARLPVDQLARAPEGLSGIEAASLPLAGLTALQALRDELRVRPGERVLLNGASGGVGTLAVQVAKALGAKVVAVCSARNADRVASLGADAVVDYRTQDVTAVVDVDHVFDVYGSLPWERARGMLPRRGRYCTTIPTARTFGRRMLARGGLSRASLVIVRSRRHDLDQLRAWVEAGALRPVIDQVFAPAQVAAACEYLETRRARGKVVIDLAAG